MGCGVTGILHGLGDGYGTCLLGCFCYLIYQTAVAATAGILLSAVTPIADWIQDGALISSLCSLFTVAAVVAFYLEVPKAMLPS